MKITIASDHAGFGLKSRILRYLTEKNLETSDLGPDGRDSVDYPDFAVKVAMSVSDGRSDLGILICGTGIGMSIAANKVPGIRAALCHNVATAEASRRHNDANVLVLGERVLDEATALQIVETWLASEFDAGRHQKRIEKIRAIEQAEQAKHSH
ncbi:MAG TPA: ribose 5-phosphate isomerase B [Candidatus Manganitrophaceae bacterium]|nr:ribose 5-phosphate isomerase B [Candidatus Manganitrophaceae bacterium]